jgi:Amt family ammonium transporter
MVWSGEHGYFWAMGAIDFAGGLVVHMSSGFSALIGCIILGPRRGYGKDMFLPHSLPLTVIGAALLWVGWFGFNAGSAAGANGTAGLAFITTNTATATALVAWVFIEWLHRGKPTVLGGATAAVAGLVAITPACASVTPIGAIWVGLGAAAICYAAVTLLKPRLGYDDSLDVFGVHGVGGAWGALATGLFIAPAALADAGTSWGGQVFIQLKSIVIVAVFAMSVSALILFALKAVFGNLRVTDEAESQGLDVHEHSETAYTG